MPNGKSEKSKKTDMVFIASMNDDLLQNILSRLPAKSFAFASCVTQSWNSVCNHILSRPKIISAFSRNPDQLRAREEVLDKVLSEPIRPDFVIANITCGNRDHGNMEETLRLITKRVGSRVPIIVSLVDGILGKEACNDKAGEVKQLTDDNKFVNFAILLTIGYLPGMKLDVIPVIQPKGESETTIGDKFVMDIRNFVSAVSDHAAPACLILFGEATHATEPIIRKLDYAMPEETTIVGGRICEFLHKRANESRIVQLHKYDSRVLAGLIFARDRQRPIQAGRIQFHTAISRGLSSVDLRYKVANSIASISEYPATLVTAKRSGEAEVLNGEQIINDIEETLLGNQFSNDTLSIGVMKRRKYSVGLEEKPKMMASLVFHQVSGGDEQYLVVDGAGIKTGDYFQVYTPDRRVAESSLNAVSFQLRNLNSKQKVVGGFVFAGSERGASFFGRPNVDSSPFLENFPELPFGGIFCEGEIGRSLFMEEEEKEEKIESSIRRCLHVCSSVNLVVSYASS